MTQQLSLIHVHELVALMMFRVADHCVLRNSTVEPSLAGSIALVPASTAEDTKMTDVWPFVRPQRVRSGVTRDALTGHSLVL